MSVFARNERSLLWTIAAVQFLNILDFMMVMPLGPDFARSLGIPTSNLGVIGASYTAAAAVSGVVASLFLDRLDRRLALIVGLLGLAFGTAVGGFATGLSTLVLARIIAGIFGGPVSAISLSIVFDVIPVERRGRALGVVMGSFAIASVLGVPLGLEAARLGGWRAPFFGLGIAVLLLAVSVTRLIPSMRTHITPGKVTLVQSLRGLVRLVRRPEVLWAFATLVLMSGGSFLLIPNLSTYLQLNLGYPREKLGLLYLAGGAANFFAMRIAGKWVDRKGSIFVSTVVSTVLVLTVFVELVAPIPVRLPVILFFMLFMIGTSCRSVASNAQFSKIAAPSERARYQSLQTCVIHLGCALGAYASTLFLEAESGGRLVGMESLAAVMMLTAVLVPVGMALARTRTVH